MKKFSIFPIWLDAKHIPCKYCGKKTTWRVGEDHHPCCPICYHTKEPKPGA